MLIIKKLNKTFSAILAICILLSVYSLNIMTPINALSTQSATEVLEKTENISKTAYSEFNPNTNHSNTIQNELAEDGHGIVELDKDHTTARDIAFTHYWGSHFAGWPNDFQAITIYQNTNPNVATATAKSSPNGLIVDFKAGDTSGTTTIRIGFTVTSLRTTVTSTDQIYASFSGDIIYTVNNKIDENNTTSQIPDYPDSSNLEDITVNTRCENTSTCYQVPRNLNEEHINGYKFSDIRENKGELGTSSMLDRYPYACTLTLNNNYWVEYFNNTLKKNGINKGTHYLSDKTKTVSMTLLYNAETGYWNYETDILYVYVTEIAPQVTYKIIREYYIGNTNIATVTSGSNTGNAGDVIRGSALNEENPNWKIRSIDGNRYEFTYEQSSPEELVLSEGGENTITLKYVARSTKLRKRFESISSIDIPTDFYMEYYYNDQETYKYTLKLKDATKIKDNLYEWEVLLPIETDVTFKEYNYQVNRYEHIGIDGNQNVIKKDHTIPSITFRFPEETSSTSSLASSLDPESGSISSGTVTGTIPAITTITNYYNYAAITVPYKVEYYDQKGSTIKETSYRTGIEGETATPIDNDYNIDGWIFDDTDSRNILSKELKESEENVLKLYFYKPVVNLHFVKDINEDNESFERMQLKKDDSYKFQVALTNQETENIIQGILDNKNGLVINDIPIGTYVIEETDDMYFDFVDMEALNSIEGISFEKVDNNYMLTITDSAIKERILEIRVNNKIESDRPYEDKEEKENLFSWKDESTGPTTYIVYWYDSDGNEIKSPETRTGTVGTTAYVTSEDKNVPGYEYNESNPLNIENKVLSKDENNELKLYFNKKDPEPSTYIIEWCNYDGSRIKQVTLQKGVSEPPYEGSLPTRPADEDYTYEFKEWVRMDDSTDDYIKYIATYTEIPIPKTITVSWYDWQGNMIKRETIDKGASPSFGDMPPVRPDDENFTYTFKEWQVMENTDDHISYIATYIPNPINSGSENPTVPVDPVPNTPTS